MALGGARIAIKAPEIIFWSARGCLKIIFSVMTLISSPLHSMILALKEYWIELKLRNNPKSNDLLQQYDEIHFHLCCHTKLELGLETILQSCLQLTLLFYALSETRTTEGLSEIFGRDIEHELTLTFLILSIIWSFVSNILSHIQGLSSKRRRFPITSKIAVAAYSFFSITTRVMAILLYFSPSLGLFNLLQHWKGEHVRWHPFLLENLITNQTVTFEGMPPKPVDFIFEDPTLRTTLSSKSFNETFLKEVKDRPFTIDGYIQFGNSSQIKWSQIDHTHHYANGTIVWPSYTLYTGLTLKIFFFVKFSSTSNDINMFNRI